MVDINKILFPTDFSEHSQVALPYVLKMVEKFGAHLHCLHVIDDTFQYLMAGSDNAVPVIISDEELQQASQKEMDLFVTRHLNNIKATMTASIIPGRPFLEIVRYAREHDIDLIIIATHGRGALASMLLGSVTEKVVRKAPCAVLTVRHRDHVFEMP